MTTARMVRKQIYIPQDLEERLKLRAREEGRSEGEIIRQSLAAALDQPSDAEREAAWAEMVAFMEARLALDVPQRKRTWKREDAYAERLSKLPGGHKHPAVSGRSARARQEPAMP